MNSREGAFDTCAFVYALFVPFRSNFRGETKRNNGACGNARPSAHGSRFELRDREI